MSDIYAVTLVGCDDETTALIRLDPQQLEMVHQIEAKINAASGYGCMPRMSVRRANAEEVLEALR